MMSSAHIFYIPVILMVGVLAGYFIGRQAEQQERERQRERLKRRKALRSAGGESNDAEGSSAVDGDESSEAANADDRQTTSP